MKIKIFLILVSIAMVGCNNSKNSSEETTADNPLEQNASEQNLSTPERIANAYGFQNWKDVSDVKFTFNVDRGGDHFARSWDWKPKTGDIIIINAKDTLSYNRSKMDSLTMNTDAAFINDKYWLLAPFQIAWDKGTTFSEKENVVAPISKDTLNQLTVLYSNDGGYTPGDAYDFFYDKDYKIKEWNYRKGNAPEPSMTTTWEDPSDYKGVEIAKMHKDSTGNFKLYFTDISVKKDSEK